MYLQLESSVHLVESVFDILDDMNIEEEVDKDLLQSLYFYTAKITNDRFKLLSFIQNLVDDNGQEGRHPLILKLYQIFLKEYELVLDSPVKLKLKSQIDSLAENSLPKDELIELILRKYRIQGLHAYLIAPSQDSQSIVGSSIFTVISQKKLMPLLQNICLAIKQHLIDFCDLPRIQMVVRQQEHYSVLDYDKETGQCFILDAAGDARQNNLLDLLQTIPMISSVVYVKNFDYVYDGMVKTTTLQKDYYSCAVFALDHVVVCAEQHNLHEILQTRAQVEDEKLKSITWFDLPAPFVRNAQSPTLKNKYCETTKDAHAKEYFEYHNFGKTVSYLKLDGMHMLSSTDDEEISHYLAPIQLDEPKGKSFS